jgi:integrase
VLKIFQRGKVWYVRGTVRGRAVYASTKETDKASARRFKDALETRLARLDGEQRAPVTFREAAELYLEARPHVTSRWQQNIARLNGVIGNFFLADIRQHVLVDAAGRLFPRGQAQTKNCLVIAPAAAVLHYAAENELCPHIKIKRFKEKRPQPRALRKEDAVKLIAAADGDLKLLLIFLFAQGWRISDTLRLTWADLDLVSGTVAYRITKTDEWLTVPLSEAVREALRDRPPQVGRVFPWRDRRAVSLVLQPLCQATGLPFTPHQARHSFATWLAAEGASVKEIMEAGAWRDHRSVLRYANVDLPRVRATMNRIKIGA